MAVFLYRAKTSSAKIIESEIEADSELSAARQLMRSGCYPLWVKAAPDSPKEKTRHVEIKDLAIFTRELSELLDSGLPLYDALLMVENQTAGRVLREIVNGIRNMIKNGSSLSEALRSYPRAFPTLYVNLARSGEEGGLLKEALGNISEFLEKQLAVRSKILAALAYPALMAVVGIATVIIMMVFVVPKITGMLVDMGETLPFATRALIGVSDFLRDFWSLLAGLLILAVFFYKRSASSPVVKIAIDKIKLKLPVLGRLIKSSEFFRFSGTLSSLLKNGIPVLSALKLTAGVIDNELIKTKVLLMH
ncbi:MAG: type II secretion system F family protein, partial [Candidatus Omnitrophica bacterium]|nr:type II secretion system F family protein [Candidatus Omnitrophota bacterium]